MDATRKEIKMSKPMELVVTLRFRPQQGLGGGFRQEWLTAKNKTVHAGLDTGAGLGNPMFTFWIEHNGSERAYFDVDTRDVLRALTEQANASIVKQVLRYRHASFKKEKTA